jgi:hypothetical protein
MNNESKHKIKMVTKKRVTSTVVAEVVGCSKEMVTKVRSGRRNADTDKGQQIEVADMLLEEGMNKLVNEVKKLVRF